MKKIIYAVGSLIPVATYSSFFSRIFMPATEVPAKNATIDNNEVILHFQNVRISNISFPKMKHYALPMI